MPSTCAVCCRLLEALTAGADQLLASRALAPGTLDLLILPEMSFSKHVARFSSSSYTYTQRYLLTPASAKSDFDECLAWATNTSLALHCGVICGCVRYSPEEGFRNSILVTDPMGQLVAVRDKHFLYESDKVWATPGPAFSKIRLDWLNLSAMVAICNDINGLTFDYQDMEKRSLANACMAQDVDLVILCTAWITAHPDDPPAAHDAPVQDEHTVLYWYACLYHC